MKVVRLSALRTGRLYSQETFLVLISVRRWVDLRPIVRPEELRQWKKSNYTIGNRTCDLQAYSTMQYMTGLRIIVSMSQTIRCRMVGWEWRMNLKWRVWRERDNLIHYPWKCLQGQLTLMKCRVKENSCVPDQIWTDIFRTYDSKTGEAL